MYCPPIGSRVLATPITQITNDVQTLSCRCRTSSCWTQSLGRASGFPHQPTVKKAVNKINLCEINMKQFLRKINITCSFDRKNVDFFLAKIVIVFYL